jgi:hypothetical protein
MIIEPGDNPVKNRKPIKALHPPAYGKIQTRLAAQQDQVGKNH